LLERVEALDDSRLEFRLARPLLKPEAWLLAPVGPAHASVAGPAQGHAAGDGPYRWHSASETGLDLRAAPDPATPDRPRILRVRETRFPTAKASIGALIRGEVSLLAHVPPDRVAELAANREIKIGRLSQPPVHWIALDGRDLVLRNRTLRRGLSYAIDRKSLLEETLLRRPADPKNCVTDGPFARRSYADAVDVKPLEYDPLLARMLVAAARKELGGDPIKLTLEYPAAPEPQAVVPRLVEAFGLAGVEIEAVERPESELETELRAGRKFSLAYRALPCVEPVLEAGGLICPGIDAAPDTDPLSSVASPRILQLLLQLERAPEWPTAKGLVLQVDRECRDELPIVPLWQLEDHYAWRTRLQGPAEVADRLYQGITTWEIAPWFARDPL
jgi:peptide/nickel transport system substrate-binding protein